MILTNINISNYTRLTHTNRQIGRCIPYLAGDSIEQNIKTSI